MKNMKGRMLRKLKTISKSATIVNDLVSAFQHKNDSSPPEKMWGSADAGDEEDTFKCLPEGEAPGGKECVVLYSTSIRAIRKTFEECNAIRLLLGSLGVAYSERDVSMHMEYREELWRVLGGCRVVPPRLFIRGRCIGGADEVVALHEKGMLQPLLQGIPRPSTRPCTCGGMHFVLCCRCNGSRRLMANGARIRCPHCNENGLIKCSLCT